MHPNYTEVAAKLEVGKTYTLFKYGEMGFPYALQFKVTRLEIKPYAQYSESLVIGFIEKGKRKERGIRFYGDNRLAIWEGLVNPNADMFNAPEAGSVPGIMVQKSFGSSFSSSYMDRALKSVEAKPLILIEGK